MTLIYHRARAAPHQSVAGRALPAKLNWSGRASKITVRLDAQELIRL
jgi:hypothetical protein